MIFFLICSSALVTDSEFPNFFRSSSLAFSKFVICLVLSKILFYSLASARSSISKLTLRRYACILLSSTNFILKSERFLSISSWISTYIGGSSVFPYSKLFEYYSSSIESLLSFVGSIGIFFSVTFFLIFFSSYYSRLVSFSSLRVLDLTD